MSESYTPDESQWEDELCLGDQGVSADGDVPRNGRSCQVAHIFAGGRVEYHNEWEK